MPLHTPENHIPEGGDVVLVFENKTEVLECWQQCKKQLQAFNNISPKIIAVVLTHLYATEEDTSDLGYMLLTGKSIPSLPPEQMHFNLGKWEKALKALTAFQEIMKKLQQQIKRF